MDRGVFQVLLPVVTRRWRRRFLIAPLPSACWPSASATAWPIRIDETAIKRALGLARHMKEQLSARDQTSGRLSSTASHRLHALTLSEFEAMIAAPVRAHARHRLRRSADAWCRRGRIQGIVMVGGSTRVPLVRGRVGKVFGKPPLTDIDPDEVVVLGRSLAG